MRWSHIESESLLHGRNSQAVTRRIMEILFDAEVKLRCDYRGVSQRKPYLFEGRLSGVRQPRERPPQVVRADHGVELVRISLHNHEDALGRELPRRPAPRRIASTAPSRIPLSVVRSGSARKCSACSAVSQWPRRTPLRLAPFTRVM